MDKGDKLNKKSSDTDSGAAQIVQDTAHTYNQIYSFNNSVTRKL